MRTNVTRHTLSFPGTKRPQCGRFVPGNESAWERNVPVPRVQTTEQQIILRREI